MAFKLPANLGIGRQYGELTPDSVTALEESLPADSRLLVGLVFSERYEGFEADCERANQRLLEEPGLSPWPEYPGQFVTPDADGEPIAWVSYQSSPAWWTIILLILGGIFILPIIGGFGAWIIDLMFPGFTEIIMLVAIGGLMFFLLPMLKPAEEKAAK
ncbi:hypothetical protein ES703_109974 [subsurface metagenome]